MCDPELVIQCLSHAFRGGCQKYYNYQRWSNFLCKLLNSFICKFIFIIFWYGFLLYLFAKLSFWWWNCCITHPPQALFLNTVTLFKHRSGFASSLWISGLQSVKVPPHIRTCFCSNMNICTYQITHYLLTFASQAPESVAFKDKLKYNLRLIEDKCFIREWLLKLHFISCCWWSEGSVRLTVITVERRELMAASSNFSK